MIPSTASYMWRMCMPLYISFADRQSEDQPSAHAQARVQLLKLASDREIHCKPRRFGAAAMLHLEEDFLPADLPPETCQGLLDLCQRRCRTKARICNPSGSSMTMKVSNGRLRLTKASDTARKLWEPTLRAIAWGWPPAQCVPPQLQRCLKESAASQKHEGRLLSMIQARTNEDLTW